MSNTFNLKTKINRELRLAAAETGAARAAAIQRIEERAERRQVRAARRAGLTRTLDGVLIGLSMGAIVLLSVASLACL